MVQELFGGAISVCAFPKRLFWPEHVLITSGVPQSSILGPLLFVLLVNDLPKVTKQCSTMVYADDMVIFSSGKDVALITSTLNDQLDKIDAWLRE